MWHNILEFFGIVGESGKGYAFWSGVGSDIGELGIIGGLLAIVSKHNCHVHHCWRVGKYPVAGTEHIACRKHHPDGHLTHEALLNEHHNSLLKH